MRLCFKYIGVGWGYLCGVCGCVGVCEGVGVGVRGHVCRVVGVYVCVYVPVW